MCCTSTDSIKLSASIGEARGSAAFLKGFAQMSLPDRIVEDTEDRRVVTRYVPVGICVGIVPWNCMLLSYILAGLVFS